MDPIFFGMVGSTVGQANSKARAAKLAQACSHFAFTGAQADMHSRRCKKGIVNAFYQKIQTLYDAKSRKNDKAL